MADAMPAPAVAPPVAPLPPPGPAIGGAPRPASRFAALLGARFTTTRRLAGALAALAAASALGLSSQLAGLHRIEKYLDELADHDEQARLALELQSALRSQSAHEAHILAGEAAHLSGYRDARARAVQLLADLDARVDEPEADAWLKDIRNSTAELDRAFQEVIAPAVLNHDPAATLMHDKSSALVHRVEGNVENVFRFLRAKTVHFHKEVERVQEETLRLAILFFVGTPVFVLAVALYLSRSIARPLALVSDGAARVAAGDLTTRIEIATEDDFGALASKFNAMTSALQTQQEKLVFSEKLAMVGRLAAGVAHELNNPLQVMLGYLSLDRYRVKGELAKHLAAVEREAIRCKEIVEDLLQLSRPAIPVVLEPVDLRDLAEEVAEALRMALGRPQPEIVVAGAGTALGTRGRLRQIVYNLAKNAADAAGPAGRVRIRVAIEDGKALAAVDDSGAGIAPEDRARIFEPFFTTKATGTGLGLPMARAVANALGGDLDVGQSDLGGARFTMRVPRAPGGNS
ncbi:MAG: ATP-binding protein [Anaeromyxobacteraceae bacterium]